jgi:hypothetical protein
MGACCLKRLNRLKPFDMFIIVVCDTPNLRATRLILPPESIQVFWIKTQLSLRIGDCAQGAQGIISLPDIFCSPSMASGRMIVVAELATSTCSIFFSWRIWPGHSRVSLRSRLSAISKCPQSMLSCCFRLKIAAFMLMIS